MSEGNIIPFLTEKKRVMITGVTRGLGLAMARGFAKRGDKVAGCGRSVVALKQLREELGDDHLFLPADVADDESVEDFCDEVVRTIGVPNLVLNNAALINQNAWLWDVPEEEFCEILDVNVAGVFRVIRHMVPYLIEEDEPAVVVNFSSGWGRGTAPEVAPYCATKWALEGLTQALAQELPNHVGAVTLNPGVIHTDMLQSCFGTGASSYPEADDWARAAVPFLANLTPADNGKALTAP